MSVLDINITSEEKQRKIDDYTKRDQILENQSQFITYFHNWLNNLMESETKQFFTINYSLEFLSQIEKEIEEKGFIIDKNGFSGSISDPKCEIFHIKTK